jgi:hypothetical protein
MQTEWQKSFSASALHAAYACHCVSNRVADPRLLQAMGDYADKLGAWFPHRPAVLRDSPWDELIVHGASIASNAELASTVARHAVPAIEHGPTIQRLAGLITDVEAAFKLLYPKHDEQSALRTRPLQEQWLGYGSGLIAHLGRLTEKRFFQGPCTIIALQPALGGGGHTHPGHSAVSIEALLINPLAELPEVVRLAWHLAQNAIHRVAASRDLPDSSRLRLIPLAMLPPVMAAAEVLELSKCNEAIAELAIEHWQIAVPHSMDVASELIPCLMDWWETYLQTRPTWELALKALSKRLKLVESH